MATLPKTENDSFSSIDRQIENSGTSYVARREQLREDAITEFSKPPETPQDPQLPPVPNGADPKNTNPLSDFDPEGDSYDYAGAKAAGIDSDKFGHFASRDPKTGLILKGMKHPSIQNTLDAEQAQGMKVFKAEDGRYYSQPATTEEKNKTLDRESGGSATVSFSIPPEEDEDFTFSEGAKQVLGGVRDAGVEFSEALKSAGDFIREKAGSDLGGRIEFEVPKVKEGGGVAGGLVRGVSQFLTGFIPLFKAVGAVEKVSKVKKAGDFTKGAVTGATTDATVFDPKDPKISNLINDLAPELKNPVTEYLATAPDDSEAEGRFKNSIEGLLLGDAAIGLFKVVKALKAGKAPVTKNKPEKQKTLDNFNIRSSSKILKSTKRNVLAMSETELVAASKNMREVEVGREEFILDNPDLAEQIKPLNFPSSEDFDEAVKAVRGLDFSSEEALGNSLKSDILELPEAGFVFDQGNVSAFSSEGLSILKLNHALKKADELGFNLEKVSQIAVESSAASFRNEEGAFSALRRFLKESTSGSDKNDIFDIDVIDLKEVSDATRKFMGKIKPEEFEGINFRNIKATDDVKTIIAQRADKYKTERAAIREPVTREQTVADAKALGLSPMELLRMEPQRLNTPEAFAMRDMRVSSALRIRNLAEIAEPGSAAEGELIKQLSLHMNVELQVTKVTKEAGLKLNMFNESVDGSLFGEVEFAKSVGFTLDSLPDGVDPQQIRRMLLSLETPDQLSKAAQQLAKPGKGDAIIEAWLNGILSGPQTHVVNIVSNALTAAWQVPERLIASGIGAGRRAITGANDGVRAGEFVAQMYGVISGMKDSFVTLSKNFKNMALLKDVEISDEFIKLEGKHQKSITAETFNLDPGGTVGRGVDYLGEFIRTPGKALMTMDEFYKGIGFRMELHAQAYRQASELGLKGEAFAKHTQKVLNNPPDNIHAASIDAARYQTFTKDLGPGGKGIQQFLNTHPSARIVVPFLRTPTNILKYFGERTPFAALAPSIQADIRAGGAKADLALARIASGGLIAGTAAMMAAEGMVTGGGPPARTQGNLRKVWLQENQPYSFAVTNKETGKKEFFSFSRLDPVGAFFGLAADFSQIAGHVSDEERESISLQIGLAVANNLSSKTWLRGISEFTEGMLSGDMSKAFENFSGSLVPTVLATAERTVDPGLSNTRTVDRNIGGESSFGPEWEFLQKMINKVKSRIPGLSEDLPALRNLWGEEIYLEGGWGPDFASPIYTKESKNVPINEEILKNKISVGMPPKTISFVEGTAPLSPNEYDDFVRLAGSELKIDGKGLKETLNSFIKTPGYKNLTDGPEGTKAQTIKMHVQLFRNAAKSFMMNPENKDYADLQAVVSLDRQQNLQKKQKQ